MTTALGLFGEDAGAFTVKVDPLIVDEPELRLKTSLHQLVRRREAVLNDDP
ncbi:MAG TPA: hypothetical protein VIS96_14920 [Terrimicrobiaceae bacterium]